MSYCDLSIEQESDFLCKAMIAYAEKFQKQYADSLPGWSISKLDDNKGGEWIYDGIPAEYLVKK